MKLGLEGKVAAITGGTTGIGREAAAAFLEEGCRVAVCGRSVEKLEEFRTHFTQLGYEVLAVKADVSKTEDIQAFADAVEEAWGGVDIWINNAGTNVRKPFGEVSEEEFDRLIQTNLKSVFFGTAIAAEKMKKGGHADNGIQGKEDAEEATGGVIINTSSFTAVIPTGGIALYSAIKAAVDSLTKTTAAELAVHNIRVLSVIPGYIETPLTAKNVAENFDELVRNIPMRRLGTPRDLAAAYVFLASEAAGYIDGTSLIVGGGKLSTQNPMWCWKKE